MLHGRNNENILHMKELLFPWEKESFVPAMQHGCRAKPLLAVAIPGADQKCSGRLGARVTKKSTVY